MPKFIRIILAVAALAGVGATVTACASVKEPSAQAAPEQASTQAGTHKAQSSKHKANKPKLTTGQKQAIKQAESYLDGPMAFSKSGLIEQLKFEGFTKAEAAYAVSHVKVSWNAQAVKKAKSYIDGPMSFSRSGLLEQLRFEGFTQAQAEHGVRVAY